METEPTNNAVLSPTDPQWAVYYKKAKATRRLGKGQHARFQTETKRRRRREYVIALASTALLVAVVAICVALLGGNAPSENGRWVPSGSADVRRG
jgi:hypothetical protein